MKTRSRKWEMVYQGLIEARNALRRGNPLDAHSHLQFAAEWASKGRKPNGALVESFAMTVVAALDRIIKHVPRDPSDAADTSQTVHALITQLSRFIEREAKISAVHTARAHAYGLSDRTLRAVLRRAVEQSIARALGRR